MKKGVSGEVASLNSGPTGAPDSQPSTLNPQPPLIPDHQLLRCIGRGSYGEVWLARSALGEYRAVKVIHRRSFGDNRPFEREFEGIQRYEPISRSHESQVQILHVGINAAEGYFYYVMELADGEEMQNAKCKMKNEGAANSTTSDRRQSILNFEFNILNYRPKTLRSLMAPNSQPSTLNSQPTTTRLPLAQCLDIGLALTTALAHLHKQGLVHRDIKPSNIIFVNGRPKLADIGLVTDVGDAQSIVGTEGYLPPEGPGAPQADIYGLGMVLYEISTGRDRRHFPDLPLDLAPQSAECGTRNAESPSAAPQPIPHSTLRTPHLAGLLELNEILLKACARDARQRYQSAEEMHADLSLLQAGKSVRNKRSMAQLLAFSKKASLAVVLLALPAAALVTLFRDNPRDTSNPAYSLSTDQLANKEYLEGVQCSRRDTKEGLAQGLLHFNRAIELDPNFTMAYNGLFEVYIAGVRLGLSNEETRTRLRASADKLMELDPTLAEAQAARAWLDFLDWKWAAAEPRFRHAIQLNPKCAIAHMRYGYCLVFAGRPDEGSKELSIAEILDPNNPRIKKNMGHVFYVKRQFHEAIGQYQRAVKLEPSYPYAHFCMGDAYRALGNYTNAINEFEQHDILAGKDRAKIQERYDGHRRAYAEGREQGYWLKCLEEAQAEGDVYSQARSYAHLKNYDQALTLIERAYGTNELESPESLSWDECWDNLRDNPRFIALLKKTGLQK